MNGDKYFYKFTFLLAGLSALVLFWIVASIVFYQRFGI